MLVSLAPFGIDKNSPKFKAARVNIMAKSDEHGYISKSMQFYDTVRRNADDIFQKSNEKSTLNLFLMPGDIFMNPSKKGFMTRKNASNGDIQADFLKTSVEAIKNLLPANAKFEALLTPGNHDFDGGDKTFFSLIKKVGIKSVMSNIDYKKSRGVQNLDKKSVPNSVVYEIPDDKNPKKKHHVMVLGVTIPSMEFYNPGLMEQVKFINNSNKKDADIKKEDLEETFAALNKKVKRFKDEHPKGAVVLMSHTGSPISGMIRDNVPGINEILNGHDHLNLSSQRGNTHISSLGQNNEMFKSIRFTFDDNGDLDLRETNTFFTNTHAVSEEKANPMKELYNSSLKKDKAPLITLRAPEIDDELSYSDEVRYKNSYLANYLTSAMKRSLKEEDPKLDSVGLQSSIIRGGIKNNATNIDLMKVFDGVSEDLSGIHSGYVSGANLVGLIGENVKSNLKAPKRNTIIHWSDIQVNRSMIEKNPDCNLYDAVKIRNKKTKKFESIDPSRDYKIAIAEKYLVKDDIKYPGLIRDNFVDTGKTYDQLFRKNLEAFDYYVQVTDKTKEQRIL